MHTHPRSDNWEEAGAVETWILPGWLPSQPPLTRRSKVMAVGSCFARQIAHHLSELGHAHDDVSLFVFDGRLTTTHAIRRHFEWALGLRELKPDETLWIVNRETMSMGVRRRDGTVTGKLSSIPLDEKTRVKTLRAIESADGFVFTVGLAESWFDRETGEAFLKAVPRLRFSPERHEHRVTSVDENRENLAQLLAAIRAVKPKAPVVFTLSPQPAVATWRPVSCVTANCVSKAVLRVAIDELVRESHDPNLYYWPSYEIATVFYGRSAMRDDGRHIHADVSRRIVELFARYFIRED
jgi:hypothetical protein